MTSPFLRSRPIRRVFAPGEAVECVDASGTALSRGGVYRVKEASDCGACGGGVSLTTGPRPTDRPCGWWRAERFRPLRPKKGDELVERIRRSKPTPAKPVRVKEDA